MLADAIEGLGALDVAQEDAGLPTVLANGSAPGESGVSILSVRFTGGMHFTAMPQCHCVCFQMPQLRIERRMAGRALRHEAPAGSLAICPAGLDCGADVEESVDFTYRRDRSRLVLACRGREFGARSAIDRVLIWLRPSALRPCPHLGAGKRCQLPEWGTLLERGRERLHRKFACSSLLEVPEPGTR